MRTAESPTPNPRSRRSREGLSSGIPSGRSSSAREERRSNGSKRRPATNGWTARCTFPGAAGVAIAALFQVWLVTAASPRFGVARVLEYFGHHFRALASLDAGFFLAQSEYCYGLFGRRGFPRRWLDDAWRIMRATVLEQFDEKASDPAIRILDRVPQLET